MDQDVQVDATQDVQDVAQNARDVQDVVHAKIRALGARDALDAEIIVLELAEILA